MGEILNMFVAVLVALCVLAAVSAETHHVITGGDGGWISSASGRVFRVGDKILFIHPKSEETVVELRSLEDLQSCNLENPIRMYTDGANHVALEKEGLRYFASGNLEKCKDGLKLPVFVQPYDHEHIRPPYEHDPEHLRPSYEPEPAPLEPEPTPLEPEPTPLKPEPKPEPRTKPEPEPKPKPVDPEEPPYKPPVGPYPVPTPPVAPSASSHLSGVSFVLATALVLCYMAM